MLADFPQKALSYTQNLCSPPPHKKKNNPSTFPVNQFMPSVAKKETEESQFPSPTLHLITDSYRKTMAVVTHPPSASPRYLFKQWRQLFESHLLWKQFADCIFRACHWWFRIITICGSPAWLLASQMAMLSGVAFPSKQAGRYTTWGTRTGAGRQLHFFFFPPLFSPRFLICGSVL